ncbi:hypothetical protein [Vibrio sp. WXL103]|uniref:hypothetical protein n=1 Tax=Vibrio sp. WXL103 TaxID=3450710 RepID=UPI003EC671AF
MNAVIVELKRMGFWKVENPLNSVRQLRLHESKMESLTTKEVRFLITEAKNYAHHVDLHNAIKLCRAIGGRFKDVSSLTSSQVTKHKVKRSPKLKEKEPLCANITGDLRHDHH